MNNFTEKLYYKSINSSENDYTDSKEELILDREDSQTLSCGEKVFNAEESVYPVKEIKVSKGFYTVYELKRKYDKKPSLVLLDSDFQRKDVWRLSQRRELVESVLMGLPLPIFYFNEDKFGRLIVIDGRQRLTSLFEFMNNKFYLDDLKILDELNKKKFKDLEPNLQYKIEDYQLMAHVIQPPTPDRIKFDIFDRVNRGGTILNKQEIRNALYQGNSTILLNDLSKDSNFIQATEESFKKDTRMKDRYLLLRFIAFYLYFNKRLYKNNDLYQYTGDVDEFLGFTMDYINDLNGTDIYDIKITTIKALNQVNFYLGDNAFRLLDYDEHGKLKRYPININIFENVMYAMTLLPYCDETIKEKTKQKFDDMKNSIEFRNNINNHRDSIIKVNERLKMIEKVVHEINDK